MFCLIFKKFLELIKKSVCLWIGIFKLVFLNNIDIVRFYVLKYKCLCMFIYVCLKLIYKIGFVKIWKIKKIYKIILVFFKKIDK